MFLSCLLSSVILDTKWLLLLLQKQLKLSNYPGKKTLIDINKRVSKKKNILLLLLLLLLLVVVVVVVVVVLLC